nr:NADH dehydrogenase subunit 6 [Oxypeltus quadrispinosus]
MANYMLMMMIINSTMFMFMGHPLSFGLILLIQTILISLFSGMLNFYYWFSYILFLVMVGGMLVLFIYMTSVASNEKFKFSSILTILMILMFLISLIMMWNLDTLMNNMFIKPMMIYSQEMPLTINLSMNKFLNWPSNMSLYTIMIYLLITLIMTVKITKIEYGPLRQKF